MLPAFSADAMRGRWPPAFERYELSLLRPWISAARAGLAKVPATIILPVVSDLIFVSDADLRKCLEADIAELEVAHAAGCLKSTVVLCGASIEALLTDAMIRESPNRPTLHHGRICSSWGSRELLNKAIEWQLIRPAAAQVFRFRPGVPQSDSSLAGRSATSSRSTGKKLVSRSKSSTWSAATLRPGIGRQPPEAATDRAMNVFLFAPHQDRTARALACQPSARKNGWAIWTQPVVA